MGLNDKINHVFEKDDGQIVPLTVNLKPNEKREREIKGQDVAKEDSQTDHMTAHLMNP